MVGSGSGCSWLSNPVLGQINLDLPFRILSPASSISPYSYTSSTNLSPDYRYGERERVYICLCVGVCERERDDEEPRKEIKKVNVEVLSSKRLSTFIWKIFSQTIFGACEKGKWFSTDGHKITAKKIMQEEKIHLPLSRGMKSPSGSSCSGRADSIFSFNFQVKKKRI